MDNLQALSINKIKLNGKLWANLQEKFCDKVVIDQWRILNGEVEIAGLGKSNCVENLRIAAGISNAQYKGHWFSDHDIAKWLEGAAYSLVIKPNKEIEGYIDYVVDLMEKIQQPDGYLNSYYTVKEPGKRWTSFSVGHELLCAGNIIEGAIAYYNATGKRKLLDMSIKLANCIYDMVYSSDKYIYDGHEEIEIALVKLYKLTDDERYLQLAIRFIETRGVGRCLFIDEEDYAKYPFPLTYFQAHKPVREQDEAVGHAVRAMYLYTAIVEIAKIKKDEGLFKTASIILDDILDKKLYLTGGVGSEHYGERFTLPYDLPSDRAYNETCAAIGFMMYARGMQCLNPTAKTSDVMEKVLHNAIYAGISEDLEKYLYVNPLSVIPEVTAFRTDMSISVGKRTEWMDCPCCPPNLLRFITSLNEYIYTYNKVSIYVNLYVSNIAEFNFNGEATKLSVNVNEPNGNIITVTTDNNIKQNIYFKIPYWADSYKVTINGKKAKLQPQNRYIILNGLNKNEKVVITFEQKPKFVYGNENIEDTAGKTAIEKGYYVYCCEEIDNGKNLASIIVDGNSKIVENKLKNGITTLTIKGYKLKTDNQLYTFKKPKKISQKVKYVPYFYWNNRNNGEMRVWLICD